MSRRWYAPFRLALKLCAYLIGHTLVALLLVGVIYVVREVTIGAGDPRLFEKVPIRYIFDGLDAFAIFVVTVAFIIEAVQMVRWEIRNEE
jgi:hypothetical protein